MSKNQAARGARDRAARLADRRREEEAHLAALAAGLATVVETVTGVERAVELANDRLRAASLEVTRAVDALAALGFRPADMARVVGAEPEDLRPGLTLSLRRTRRRRRRSPPVEHDSPPGDEPGEPAGPPRH